MYDYIIIGGGIVGLATSMLLTKKHRHAKILLLEKEADLATHQTGHNSGVIHSGIYYKPGSLKARFAKRGNESLINFCKEHAIDYDLCGKVIVATENSELPRLHALYQRGLANGLTIDLLNREQLQQVEPYVSGIAAISVPEAGIINFRQVAKTYAEVFQENGGEIHCREAVTQLTKLSEGWSIKTTKTSYQTKYLINCAGLYSDRIAKLAGYHLDMKIVPFRGEYYMLKDEKSYYVRHLIYPVPDPRLPFLGVHFTRMIDGKVEAGPNAVLSFKREGYQKTDVNVNDTLEILSYPGLQQLALKYFNVGITEMIRSFSKQLFVKSLQRLIPHVKREHLVTAPAGVRAQALSKDGQLIDDFYFIQDANSLHVCNAPSPAATASLEIGKEIVRRLVN